MANRKGRLDPFVFTIKDLEEHAAKKVPSISHEYFAGGAGDLLTLHDNEAAYNRYKLRPRVLRNVDNVDTSTTIFGIPVSAPLGFAPVAAHKLAHPDGESATSQAAAMNNIPMCLSSWSTLSLEEVIAAGGSNPYAMQITFLRDISITQRIIQRAEQAGYKALFISVDLPVLGNRLNESRNNFTFPADYGFPNLPSSKDGEQLNIKDLDYDPTIIWEEIIPWLKENTKLELWLKGIYTAEDVQLAIDYGLDGVIISNHGGRQLDGVPATLDALRECAPVAHGKIKIAVDGGIRRGSDLFKAIALGADFGFVGRIPIWGLAYNGVKGVDLAIKILMEEFQHTMMLSGCKNIRDIQRSHLSVLAPNGILAKL